MSEFRKIQYNCKKATFLIEKKQMSSISFREAIELRIHLMGCNVCRVYNKQSVMINEMVQKLFRDSTENYRLDDKFKKGLQEKIEEELNK